MKHVRFASAVRIIISLALVLTLVGVTGCGSKKSSTSTTQKPAQGQTAKQALPTAQSALATTAPDAKLLLIQTAQAVSTTSTPVWAYLFGSPKTEKLYVVRVSNGAAMPAQEYGSAKDLGKFEWDKVPNLDQWKIDSNEAYDRAYKASGAKTQPPQYVMGMLTYVPKTEQTSTAEPFVWAVQFDPGQSGATPNVIDVNATTGATKVQPAAQQ